MKYVGNELELFQGLKKWKGYWISQICEEISGRVLEVGSGICSNTDLLQSQCQYTSWQRCEPDPDLAKVAQSKGHNLQTGTLENQVGTFDTIIYIDVLEHIRDSRAELELAYSKLTCAGKLIILVPAFDQLYSPFDEAVGHYRRYNKQRLREDAVRNLFREHRLFYLDSLGLVASIINKFVLKKEMPTRKDLAFYDRVLLPFSRILDIIVFSSFGKSLVGVFVKNEGASERV